MIPVPSIAHKVFVGISGVLAVGVSLSRAQDSVATAPGATDALSAYDTGKQTVSYVLDLAAITSSWGGAFSVGPLLKAPAELDPLFPTQIAGSTAVSADQFAPTSFPQRTYALWTAAGQGVNAPGPNAAATQSVQVTGFDRQFGVALTGVSAGATNIVTTSIGQNAANPLRLLVRRTTVLCSRGASSGPDTATLALGAVDPAGVACARADGFNTATAAAVLGDNVVTLNPAQHGSTVATLSSSNGANQLSEPASSSWVLNNAPVSTNTPALMPITPSPSLPLLIDFAMAYRPGGVGAATTHLASGIEGHRGNPSAATLANWGGAGIVGVIGRSAASHRADSLNLFAVDASGSVVTTRSARPPVPLTGPGGYTTNGQGNAEFKQYNNQSLFRGPSGHLAVGFDPGSASVCAAGVLVDPAGGGECIAVARFVAGTPTWTVAARVGTPILSGPGGSTVATITQASPVTFSAPALDRLGNAYFVAQVTPTGGSPTQALLKGVRRPDGSYQLERILQAGQTVAGVNSTRTYTISRLTLADSDSISSGTFHAGALLQQQLPGRTTTDPASPLAFGGCVVNAKITYNNAGTPESYDAALWVGARSPAGCQGDLNADGHTNTADLTILLANFGHVVTPGSSGDLNADGVVNTADLTLLLAGFGCGG